MRRPIVIIRPDIPNPQRRAALSASERNLVRMLTQKGVHRADNGSKRQKAIDGRKAPAGSRYAPSVISVAGQLARSFTMGAVGFAALAANAASFGLLWAYRGGDANSVRLGFESHLPFPSLAPPWAPGAGNNH